MSLMNGDMSMLSNILGSMDLISILQRMMETYFATSPYGPIVKQYMTMFLESEQVRLIWVVNFSQNNVKWNGIPDLRIDINVVSLNFVVGWQFLLALILLPPHPS